MYFLNFYFLNMDISFTIHNLHMKFWTVIQNILIEWSVSQNFYLSPSYIFIG